MDYKILKNDKDHCDSQPTWLSLALVILPAILPVLIEKLGDILMRYLFGEDASEIDQEEEKLLSGTEFFEVDIDQEQKLAERFPNQSIPYILFYYNGKKINIESDRYSTLDGGTIGGFQKDEFVIACKKILKDAKEGQEMVRI
jgi:hypothetical protein